MPVRLVSQEELPGPLKGYRLIERLGRGGFGEVWKVEAPGGLLKAAKFVFGDLEAMDEESRPADQERKALERVKGIRHPYILSLEQFRIIDGQLIIVMELADRNLWDRFRECRGQGLLGIPRDELMRYMEETAEALDLMNNHYQIQHLDVKPQNLFLVFNHIKVADFGLAKVLEGVKATVTGGVTPVYAAPETFEGWVSRYSDQYSLAIVFQELLTGYRPFNGTNTRQLLMQHINGTPELSSLPLLDRTVIARALAKKPDDRWPTCTELVKALKLAAAAPAPPPQAPQERPSGSSPAPQEPPGSGARTMLSGSGHALADSIQATRMAPGGSGRLNAGNDAAARERTPAPAALPPLVKPGAVPNTPAPAPVLLSPPQPGSRLVTPSTPSHNPAQTLSRQALLQTGRMGSLGIAPPEKAGDGALFPALVVALGRTGRRVVEQLRRAIADRHGSVGKVPNVRVLYVDTDLETVNGTGSDASGLPDAIAPNEIIHARLNRSQHYMQRESLPPVEHWLPSGALYRLPRNPDSTGGVRAFGRLALFDHYRTIAQRVRQEIETFLTDDALMQSDRATLLGLRTNRPRAYIVAGLAGGTGGGMFLDLAFLVRHEMRQVGYLRPDVVGLFFVPPAGPKDPRGPALGNTYAALAELSHFQARKSRYQTIFDRAEAPITDNDAPFSRTAIIQMAKAPDSGKAQMVLASAARALYYEILTPTGRATDEGRDVYRNAFPAAVPTCQTFGLFRLSWPRPEVLTAATRRFAQRQLQRWAAKESPHLRERIAEWLAQEWSERKLSFEALIEALNGAVRATLREEPERVFDAFVDPLRTRTPSSGRVDATSACTALENLLKLVGKPECELESNGSIVGALTTRFEELIKETEQQIAVMAATFIERPQFRLAGAEEAVRQIGDKLKLQVDTLEPVRADLSKDTRTTYGRLLQVIGALGSTGLSAMASRKSNAAEVLELLRVYPRKRLQLHVLDMALAVFRKLLGNAPEYLRDINSCRATLGEMHASLAKAPGPALASSGRGKMILPDNCTDLDAAADQFLATLTPEDLLAFDQTLQKNITRKFRSLGSVCLKPQEKGPGFRDLLLTASRTFLDTKLDHSDPATVLFRSRTQIGSAESLMCEAFEEARPDLIPLGTDKHYEMVVLGAPVGEDGERLQALVHDTLPDLEMTAAPLPDDICFYREYPQLPLTSLPQLAGHAREAFLQMGTDHPPHTRADVPWVQPGH
jgi:serine/threonine protein kinase